MDRRTLGALAALAGLGLGLVGNAFFFGRLIGLSFPLFIAAGVVVLLAFARLGGMPVWARNLWPLIPGLFFAVMVAVRADVLVVSLNIAAVLALGALAVYYLPLRQPLDQFSFVRNAERVLLTGLAVLPYALLQYFDAWDWLKEKRAQRGGAMVSTVRGLAFAVPVLAVFVVLLGSADAVFANLVSNVWEGISRALGINFLDDTVTRLMLIGFLAVVTTGALGYGVMRRAGDMPREDTPPAPAESEDGAESDSAAAPATSAGEKRKPAFKLTLIESGIVLGSVVALFAVFVVIQFAYFFGGEANVGVEGLTYAQYARRGFFELVAVSTLTLGLALWLDSVTVRQPGRENTFFRVLALALAGLTGIMLLSASQRMLLYEDAFGFTQLRVYTHVFMHWLGAMFGVYALALFRVRPHIFSTGLLVVLIGYLVTLNLMNVDLYIAERNIARYHEGKPLDVAFLNILSADAVPAILPLYQQAEPGTELHNWAGQWLARELSRLDDTHDGSSSSVFSTNLSRGEAWAQLDAARDALPVFDSSLFWRSYLDASTPRNDDFTSGWDLVATPSAPGSR